MSDYLNETIALTDKYDSEWYSWIFEANVNNSYEIIASSNNIITEDADSVEGCLQFSDDDGDDYVAYSANEHPTETIALMSEEIISGMLYHRYAFDFGESFDV